MGDEFYILESGQANANIWDKEKKEYIDLKNYKPGDYFGELALTKQQPRSCNIIALVIFFNLERLCFIKTR